MWISGPQHGGFTMAQGSSKPSTAAPSPQPTVYICGQPLVQAYAGDNRSGLRMAISAVRRSADNVGPDVTVTFTATSPVFVASSPPQLFEVLYLRDGIIVGGGPMLNMPGDGSRQTLDLVRYGFAVEPGRPSSQDLGRRDTLCPGLTWRQVWAAPQSFEVVVLQGPVTGQPPEIFLGIPAPHLPLLAGRSSLPR
jgi:hypothetical protein